MMEKKSIFREKSLERIQSPEQLNDYIKVTSPSVWLVMIALVLLLIGIVAWSILGTVTVESKDGVAKTVHPVTFVTN